MPSKPQCRLAEKARILTVKTDMGYVAKGAGRLYFCILFCCIFTDGGAGCFCTGMMPAAMDAAVKNNKTNMAAI